MIDAAKKIGVCSRLGWHTHQRQDGSWQVIEIKNKTPYAYTKMGLQGWETKELAEMVCWAFVIKTFDLYLHKKGGIYLKNDERPLAGTEQVIVNYEHIYPHDRAPASRFKEEWETPGRFVKITAET